ncbi:MAG: hypothetical protein EXR93_03565 [Gemmatimonadetes bacterium]|nr:hypothetical protein [Gemmatimonadota bacterium]
MSDQTQAPSVAWPPPGLEPLHGKLEPIVTLLGLGDLLLVLPLLAAVGTPGPFWSTGPFGGAWWMPLFTTFVGVVILTLAMVSLTQLLRFAATGAARGHGWRGILLVASDDSRDTGFVLQGARAFSGVASTRRDRILVLRLVAAGGILAAGILMPAGFAVSVVLGRWGVAGLGLFWTLSLGLPITCLLVGLSARLGERLLSSIAYRDQARRQAAEAQISTEVGEWNRQLGKARPSTGMRLGNVGRTGMFKAGAWGVSIIALAVIVPVTFLSIAGFVGSLLAQLGTPVPPGDRARMAAVEVLRRQRLPFDPAASPDSAGAALHALYTVGIPVDSLQSGFRRPIRVYAKWWHADSTQVFENPRTQEAESLFVLVERLSGPQRAYLARVAAHPAHAEFARLSGARSVDMISQRWTLPFSDSLTLLDLPLPRLSERRNARCGK